MSTRVLVVDDTVVFRRAVCDALAGLPEVEVVGTASNGRLALARIGDLKPDLLTLDIEMPEMNGLELLRALRDSGRKTAAIVLSGQTARGGELTVRALELGAFDFLTKPEGGNAGENLAVLRDRLAPLMRAFARRREVRDILKGAPSPPPAPTRERRSAERPVRSDWPVVLIGVSTGGPAALARVLPALPPDLGAPVLVVQHMPALFTAPLAASLAAKCALPVKEAADGEPVESNRVYLAPGGSHLKVGPGAAGGMVARVTSDPPENNCRPSVDTLFRSMALHFPGRAVAAILTGMGRDGAAGLAILKRGGCFSIAQDEATSVVFGMPREAIAAGVVDVVAPLEGIAPAILRAVREARR